MTPAYAYRWGVQAVVGVLGAGGFLMGTVLIVGGSTRFAAPAFVIARTVPYSPYSWGAVIATSGAATLLGAARNHRTTMSVALLAQACWFLFFDLSLVAVAAADLTTPLTGCVIYAMVSALYLVAWGASRELARHTCHSAATP